MENNTLKEAKKQFSQVGLVLFVGTLLIYGVQTLTSIITMNIPAIAENGTLSFLAQMLSMYIIAFPIIFYLFKRVPVQTDAKKKKMPFLHLMASFFIAYAILYVFNILGSIMTTIIGMFKQGSVDHVLLNVVSSIDPAANFLIIVICAPILEELVFRKAIIDRTCGYGEGISILFSGLLFGLFHGNLVQFTYAFVLGIFLGFIYIKTRNILYPIILHMMVNFLGSFVSTFILEWSGYIDVMKAASENATEAELMAAMMENVTGLLIYSTYAFCIFGFVIAGILIFCINRKKFTLSTGEIILEKGQRFKTLILNLGVLLYCIFWIAMIIRQLLS